MSTSAWLLLVLAILIGCAAGLGGFTFVYAKGYSYLTSDPAACANCHIMDEHYSAWLKSSHRFAATCNDCHTPHGPVSKWAVKAQNGFWHSFYFTTGNFPDPLRITAGNQRITEQACRDCHRQIADTVDFADSSHGAASISCVKCHRYVGHWVR